MAEAVPKEVTRLHFDPRGRKRKRLNAVLDKISSHISSKTNSLPIKTTYASKNGDSSVANNNENNDSQLLSDNQQLFHDSSSMFGGPEQNLEKGGKPDTAGPGSPQVNKNKEASPPEQLSSKMSKVSFRHDLWQDHSDLQQQPQQQTVQDLHKSFFNTVGSHQYSQNLSLPGAGIFKFDSLDRDRHPSRDHHAKAGQFYFGSVAAAGCPVQEGEAGEFSPASGRSPHSSLSSPQVSMDSPRICFSPLKIKDPIEEEEDPPRNLQR
jgi:hypothetical protein